MGTHPIFESDFDCLTEIGKKMPRKSRKVPEQTMETTAKTLDRRGESINTTDIPEDAATIKKNAEQQFIRDQKEFVRKRNEAMVIYPSTPDDPGLRRSTRVKFLPGCPERTGRVLTEEEIKEGKFLLGNFHLVEPTTAQLGIAYGNRGSLAGKTAKDRNPKDRK